MKKRKYVYFWISLAILGMTGCITEPSNDTITETLPIESSDNKEMPTPTSKPEEEKTTTADKSSDIFFTKTEEPIEIVTKTEGLCEVLEKTDALVQARYNSFNRMLSTDGRAGFAGNSLFCVDESTGVIYFVNQGRDYYLYRIKNGEVELAVAMPVKELYPYQGSIYFMIDNYDIYELKDMHNGDIYCYTPESGAVELIYAAGAIENSEFHRLTVEESGIYFSYESLEETIISYYYHLPFGETEPIRDTRFTVKKGWNDYYFSITPKLTLKSRTVGEDGTRDSLELSASSTCFCVVGDMLYSAERTYISCINLKTGEKTTYDFFEIIKKVQGEEDIEDKTNRIIESFVITEENIWIATPSILYCLNLQSGEVSYCYVVDEKDKLYSIETLYTDGKELYMVCSLSENNVKIAHVLMDQRDVTNVGTPVIRLKFLTE